MISCRVVSEGGEIIEESELMDKKIAQIPGVELIISCLTGTKSNNNRAASSQEDLNSITIRKGLAYFIVTKTEAVEDEVCKAIYDGGFDGKLSYIKPRSKNRESKEIALAALSTVVKVSD